MTNNRIARLAVNEEGFVFDPQTGESFTVNETGKTILKALIESKAQEGIAMKLTEQFNVSHQEAQTDVRDFLQHLRAYQLL
ncbi:MAG: HPr-rel-A system PqqD family peptide chaperone [Pseudomonadota bacterium]